MSEEMRTVSEWHGIKGTLQNKNVIFDLKIEGLAGLLVRGTGKLSIPGDAHFLPANINRKFTLIYEDERKLDITIINETGQFIVDRGPYLD